MCPMLCQDGCAVYGIIFDVDGVIADTEPVNAEATIKAFADLFEVRGVKRRDFDAGLGRGAENYIRAAAQVHGVNLTDAQVATAAKAREENILTILGQRPLSAFPGVLGLMEAALARNDFRLAIATSSSRKLSEAALRSVGVPFNRMTYVTGADVKNKKPHPDLFLTASERMGVPPGRSVVIEDAPDGVQAARAAGCKCIAVTNSTGAENLSAAGLVVASLTEVDPDVVMRLISASFLR